MEFLDKSNSARDGKSDNAPLSTSLTLFSDNARDVSRGSP